MCQYVSKQVKNICKLFCYLFFFVWFLQTFNFFDSLYLFDNIEIFHLQCNNGHLMCAGCFTHLLADARLRDETATCPNCRVEICKTTATRNLAVENAVSELPSECQYCGKQFPRNSLERHEEIECEER